MDRTERYRWTLRALLHTAGVPAEVSGDAELTGLAHDSREVSTGDLFCCIPGARADGHDHAPAAVEAGASALLCERDPGVDGVPVARVERVRDVLGPVSSVFFDRPSEAMQVVGITGTNGKTTVTYLVEAMARAAGKRAGVIGNIGRRLGDREWPSKLNLPEAPELHALLAEMRDAGGDVVAMEVTSEGIDQGRSEGMRYACVTFTNLSQDHLNYHGTMDAYFEAKARIFAPAYASRAAVNTADPHGRILAGRAEGLDVLTFAGSDAEVTATDVVFAPEATRLRLGTPIGSAEVVSGLVGPYNLENLLSASATAVQLGLPLDAIVSGAEAVGSVPGRLERVEAGQDFAVLVDYAHSPDALERALEAARALADGRLIVVFGCGGDRDRAKRPLMGEAATRVADRTLVTSDNPRSEDPMAIIDEILPGAERGGGDHRVVPDRREAIGAALAEAGPGDVVLVAGKGHESGQTFVDRTIPFDDREVVREELEALGCRR